MHITTESGLCTNTAQCNPTLIIIIYYYYFDMQHIVWYVWLFPLCYSVAILTQKPEIFSHLYRPQRHRFNHHLSSPAARPGMALHSLFFSKGDEMIQQCLQCFQKISFEKLFSVLVHVFISLDSRFLVGVWLRSPRRYSSDITSASITRFHPYHGKDIPYLMKTWVKSTPETKVIRYI